MRNFIILLFLVFVIFKGYGLYNENKSLSKNEYNNITKEQLREYSTGIIVSDDLSAPLNNFKFFIKIISNNTK